MNGITSFGDRTAAYLVPGIGGLLALLLLLPESWVAPRYLLEAPAAAGLFVLVAGYVLGRFVHDLAEGVVAIARFTRVRLSWSENGDGGGKERSPVRELIKEAWSDSELTLDLPEEFDPALTAEFERSADGETDCPVIKRFGESLLAGRDTSYERYERTHLLYQTLLSVGVCGLVLFTFHLLADYESVLRSLVADRRVEGGS